MKAACRNRGRRIEPSGEAIGDAVAQQWPTRSQFINKFFKLDCAGDRTVGDHASTLVSCCCQKPASSRTATASDVQHSATSTSPWSGTTCGMWVGYAMAADWPERIARIALGEAIISGVAVSPPLIPDERPLNDFLWHNNFCRVRAVTEELVTGREEIFFDDQFTKIAVPHPLAAETRQFYIDLTRVGSAKRSPPCRITGIRAARVASISGAAP